MPDPEDSNTNDKAGPGGLTHLNDSGEARMVDVGGKSVTQRSAMAEATVRMSLPTHAAVLAGDVPKGDVLGTARIAGIMAAKRTHEAIPMCHPLAIDSVKVEFRTDVAADAAGRPGILVSATVRCTGRTGVEMEALHAVAVAALTIYDMAKAMEKGMEITGLKLLEKTGGKSGDWKA